MMEEKKMSPRINDVRKLRKGLHPLAVLLSAALILLGAYQKADAQQKTFDLPEEAVKSLIGALRSNDTKELLAIFGPAGKEVISSGDEVADKAAREHFIQAYEEMSKLEKETETRMTLIVGKEEWPFPIPLVKKGKTWVFDTPAGREELINRRIGRNELNTIQACLAYVDAQREYAMKDRNNDRIPEYAQKFRSEKGKKDGLYWEAKAGEEQSPLGPLVVAAVREGYGGKKQSDKLIPFNGYYFRILKAQGKNAPGGDYDYVIRGRMIGGFALVAYPAQYGVSGIMTFLVNHDAVVYQKDLGKETAKTAAAMTKFDPDKTWTKVEGPEK
jgi:hypothetical protein